MPNFVRAYEQEMTRAKQAVIHAMTRSAQATQEQLLRAANKTGLVQLYNDLTWKKLWVLCFCLSCALTFEHQSGLPLVSGMPQLMSAVLSNTAYLFSLMANTMDPFGNPITADLATLCAAGWLHNSYRAKQLNEAPEVQLAELATAAKIESPLTAPSTPTFN